MQNGGEAGIRTPDAAFDRILLSRGAPSASRPPHHTPLTSASKNLFLLFVAAMAHILLSGTYKSNLFRDLFFVCTLPAQLACENGKRVFYQQEIADYAAANAKDNCRGCGERDKMRGYRRGKLAKNGGWKEAPHKIARRENLSNWTAGIFQPGYAGRSLHDARRLL